MARNERQEDDARGGVGTISRPGVRQRRAPEPRPAPEQGIGAPQPAPRRGRQERQGVPPQRTTTARQAATAAQPVTRQRPDADQRTASGQRRPGTGSVPNAQAVPNALTVPAAAGPHRMPFVLLLCGLLGGALVSALVISTTLAEGAFETTKLQDATSALSRERQALEEQVAQAQSAQVIEARAVKLGMRPVGELRFVDLKTGETSTDGTTSWVNGINVPGYTP